MADHATSIVQQIFVQLLFYPSTVAAHCCRAVVAFGQSGQSLSRLTFCHVNSTHACLCAKAPLDPFVRAIWMSVKCEFPILLHRICLRCKLAFLDCFLGTWVWHIFDHQHYCRPDFYLQDSCQILPCDRSIKVCICSGSDSEFVNGFFLSVDDGLHSSTVCHPVNAICRSALPLKNELSMRQASRFWWWGN